MAVDRPIFIYHDKYLKYDFGDAHVLREERLLLAKLLMQNYGLIGSGGAVESSPDLADESDLLAVHDLEYLEALKRLSDEPHGSSLAHGLGIADNPVFRGMFEAASLQVGGTILACDAVAKGEAQRAFNMGGGFHHAMPARASGFCLLNDIAIAIRHLLAKSNIKRVMYVDIDVHHADGVQAIFAEDSRVLKVSLHEDGRYLFPGTGAVDEIGGGQGEGYAVNIPLPPYTGDVSYLHAFKEIVMPLAEAFKPEVLFTQLGADAHFADPLAHLNLTTRAYEGVAAGFDEISRHFCGGRWVAVTGGGYDMMLCPRIWALFFSRMTGKELDNNLPAEFMEYCKVTYATAPENGALRDAASASNESVVSRAVAKVVEDVKKNVFRYHGLG